MGLSMTREPRQALATADLVRPGGFLCDPVLVIDLARPVDSAWLAAAVAERRVLIGFSVDPPTGPAEAIAAALDVTFVAERSPGPSVLGHGHACSHDCMIQGSSGAVEELPRYVVVAADPVDAAYDLAQRICDRPLAGLALAEVLRLNAALPAEQGLAVESYAYSALLAGEEFRVWREGRESRDAVAARPDLVRVEREDDVLRIRLDHAERRNSYSARLRDQLVDALQVARLDSSVKRVELSGEGPSFCSGGDLDEFGTTPDPVLAHLIRTTAGAAPSLLDLSDRLTAHMHGPCVGAGVELAAFAERVVAAPDLAVWMPEVGMGLMPGAGGTVSLPRRIGRWRTAYLALSGEKIDARTALAWGLVDEVAA